MLSFAVYSNGKPADHVNLSGSYVVGSDEVPLRADIASQNGIISCKKRAAGPAGLAMLWDVPGTGRILLETIRVQEREKPYILPLELARGRLMRINNKLEDWGMLDHEGAGEVLSRIEAGRDLLIRALQADTPAQASALADQSLHASVKASEALTMLHAELFLARRKQTGGFARRVFGCSVPLDPPTDQARQRLSAAFDFVNVPIVWRDIEPTEQTFNWRPLEAWVEMLAKHNIPMRGSTLLSFNERNVPDWLYIWEHDFDTIRDLAFEHVRRVINRFGQYIQTWTVVSGIHANNCFSFNFEQVMELTRMAAALTKQLSPRGTTIVELVGPWGEYYARNQRTIPPMLFADMAVQSGVNFDAFGLRFHFGPGVDGMFVRDMFQISSLLDQFSKLNKPLHITAVQVPSSTAPVDGATGPLDGGTWHEPWNERVQAEWLRQFVEIALSKPFVETVSWQDLMDHAGQSVPHGGLLRSDLVPKPAYEQLVDLRAQLVGRGKRGGTTTPA